MENLETIAKNKEKIFFRKIKSAFLGGSAALAILIGGCNAGGTRPRWGYLPTGSFGNPDALGKHSSRFGLGEGAGILYTLRGGSLDIDHVRGAADITKVAHDRAYSTLLKKGKGFSLSPAFERFSNNIEFQYPDYWDKIRKEDREKIAKAVSLKMGQYVGFNSTLYHELTTWYGGHFLLIEAEFNSSFSWDDLYSNLIGTRLAVEAIKDKSRSYNEAMTLLLEKELHKLGVVSKSEARRITKTVRGKWYGGGNLTKRNMDIGEDGYITPSLIPGAYSGEPFKCPVPTLDLLNKCRFKIRYTFSSMHGADGKMRRLVNSNGPIQPKHFPSLMRYVKEESAREYGHDIDQ